MPFTFSHPAIILPLTFLPKQWFSLTGLIIGSLTPDFEYFLRMKIESNYSHTIAGLFWFDLPLGILLAFFFHNIVRNSLFDNLPKLLNFRFSSFKQFDWNVYFKRNWFIVIISILIGAASHLFWDSFTHDHGYFVQIIPFLSNKVDFFSIQIPILKILQHSSTLIGGIAIAFVIYRMPLIRKTEQSIDSVYWIILIALALTVVSVRLLTGLEWHQYGNLIVSTITAGILSLILTPIILTTIKKSR
jgi:hypothetical protein